MTSRVAAALVLVVPLAGCGGAGPHFQRAAGWHLLSGHGQLAAANVPFSAADRSLKSPPSRTVATLPRYGIVIWLLVGRHHKSKAWDRKFPRIPLRVDQAVATNPPEGFFCAHLARSDCFEAGGSIRRMQARVGDWDIAATFFFGTDRPLTEDVAAADAELARLRVPGARATNRQTSRCPRPTGTGYYRSTVEPSSGPPGSTAIVSGRLPAGQTELVAYWNLDFDHWPSVVSARPRAAVSGSAVRLVGMGHVAGRCTYRLRVEIPSAPAGTYPLEVLYGNAKGGASFAPAVFRVTSG
ncbi:MAG TPA: hypothetical protein VJ814_06420 [Gaiellaceae bacterium]|nr:hypothetical protein [Gaiellaceae bacterium]